MLIGYINFSFNIDSKKLTFNSGLEPINFEISRRNEGISVNPIVL